MIFGNPRSRHNANATALSAALRAPQQAPNVRSGTSLRDNPALAFGVTNRFANVFVRVIGHYLRLSRSSKKDIAT